MLDDSHVDRDPGGFEKLSADLTKRAQVVAEELRPASQRPRRLGDYPLKIWNEYVMRVC